MLSVASLEEGQQAAAAQVLAVPWAPGAVEAPAVAVVSPALAALCGEHQVLELPGLVAAPAEWPVRGEVAPAAVAVLQTVQAGHKSSLQPGISGLPAWPEVLEDFFRAPAAQE